jgi:cysteinyl-tRNA synthetase
MAETPKLRLYNTLTREKEPFVPLDPANVRMYVCGPTVYDFAHIGNARPVIVFDVLYRLLRHLYGEKHVTYVRNITDIDDKINKRAFERWTKKPKELQRPLLDEMRDLTEGTAAQYKADVRALGCLDPDHEPRATEYVCDGGKPTDMVRVIERLVDRGVAYAAEGHVLFSPKAMDALATKGGVPPYGRLSRRPLDEMIAGARVDVAPYKRDPMDFVLWKPSDRETEPGWESPWGFGRPGWHIECSAMSAALLGQTFDIHGGGIDLQFPHHENEIAQSCCAFGIEKMASVWMHNGFLQVEGQKMSKSLGNFVTIREVLNDWPGEVVRLNMLKTHYRQPIDWTVRGLEESRSVLSNWGEVLRSFGSPHVTPLREPIDAVTTALGDDLNFQSVMVIMHEWAKAGRSGDAKSAAFLASAGQFLGLVPERWDRANEDKTIEMALNEQAEVLIATRLEARRAKNFAESDRIRDELAAMGIQLKDGKDADGNPTTTWEVKR